MESAEQLKPLGASTNRMTDGGMQFLESVSSQSQDDSDEPPDRWQQSSSLEMDCVFLDEDASQENNLPDVFDV